MFVEDQPESGFIPDSGFVPDAPKDMGVVEQAIAGAKVFASNFPKYYGKAIDDAFTPSPSQPKLPLAPQAESTAGQVASGAYNTVANLANSIPTAGMATAANPIGLAYAIPHFAGQFKDAIVGAVDAIKDEKVPLQQKVEAVSNVALGAGALAAGVAGVVKAAPKLKAMVTTETPALPKIVDEIVPAEVKPKTLADAEKVFSAIPEEKTTIVEKIKELPATATTELQNQFYPVTQLEKNVTGNSPKLTLGDRFSLVAGAAGKAEADIYALEQARKSMIPDVDGKDLNSFMFLRRTFDRLSQEQKNPEGGARSVADWTIDDTQKVLGELKGKIGDEKMARMEEFAGVLQKSADADLRLMVDSGRMSEAQYAAIKEANDFYAPFKVMKYMSDSEGMSGAGKSIDTTVPLSKAIQGISDADFRLGDIFTAMAQNKYRAYVLAEKNRAMLAMADLAKADPEGTFIKRIPVGKEPPKGFESVNFMQDGFHQQLAVEKSVADAVKGLDPVSLGVISNYLSKAATPFRWGATGLNIGFQIVNLPMDAARLATMSKYGLRSAADIYRFPMDFLSGMASSWKSNVFNMKDELAMDYLRSGAARSTIQSQITPNAFNKFAQEGNHSAVSKLLGIPEKYILNNAAKIGNAIEETTKMMGIKRAQRYAELNKLTPAARQKALDEMAYEVRNYAGSPDFSKHGATGKELNLIFMFANARIQGAAADLRRLAMRTGKAEGAAAAARLGATIGVPTAALWYFNNRPENEKDYANRTPTEKQNYWLIPRYGEDGKPLYFNNEAGEQTREYWRVPKRDIMASVASTIEGGMDYAKRKDPDSLLKAGTAMVENLSPFQITGKTFAERGESIISGANPLIKAPIEMFLNRSTSMHRPVIPDRLINASPELQTTKYTPPAFNAMAQAMPDFMPDRLRSPVHLQNLVNNLSGSAITQFMRQPQEGRSPWVNSAIIGRFFSSPYNNNEADWQKVANLRTEATDRSVLRENAIAQFLKDSPALDTNARTQAVLNIVGNDPKNIQAIVTAAKDEAVGMTSIDRAIRQLPPKERAQFVWDKMNELPSNQAKRTFLADLLKKGVVSNETLVEVARLKSAVPAGR